MFLEIKNVSKFFGEQAAVNDVSFSLSKGEITGFLGPNGAGKSTTMKMITGYLKPDAGNIVLDGKTLHPDDVESRRKIGYLSEANPLYTDMYVKEYLTFIANVHQLNKPQNRINEVMELTGLVPEKNKKAGQLSKGYKQRLGLAAAIIHDPELLILDEPTTGLDPNQIIEIRTLIKTLGRSKTVLFSSHIMQEVQAICNHVIIINKGKLIVDDSLENLLTDKNQTLEQLFQNLTTV